MKSPSMNSSLKPANLYVMYIEIPHHAFDVFLFAGWWSMALLLQDHLFLRDVPGDIDLLHLRTAFDNFHNLGVSQISWP